MGGLVAVIGFLLFSDISKSAVVSSDSIDPYVLSTQGKTLIIRDKIIPIAEKGTGAIRIGDRIRTLATSSATIFWPDGSVTRLGEKSSIKIHEMHTNSADDEVKIDFSLEQGKSWSNIVKYLFGESYFHERYNNDSALATVRGTVFEIDLDRRYIHTVDHAVTLTENSGSLLLAAGAIVDSETQKALAQSILDGEWNKLNTSEDLIYINSRLERFNKAVLEKFGHRNYFDVIFHPETHDSLMALYQEINAFPNTPEFLERKMQLRDAIIATADPKERQAFVTDFARLTLYDSWKAENTTIRASLESKLQEYLKAGADQDMIESLKRAFDRKSLENLNNHLEDIKQKTINTLGKENYMDQVTDTITKQNFFEILKEKIFAK